MATDGLLPKTDMGYYGKEKASKFSKSVQHSQRQMREAFMQHLHSFLPETLQYVKQFLLPQLKHPQRLRSFSFRFFWAYRCAVMQKLSNLLDSCPITRMKSLLDEFTLKALPGTVLVLQFLFDDGRQLDYPFPRPMDWLALGSAYPLGQFVTLHGVQVEDFASEFRDEWQFRVRVVRGVQYAEEGLGWLNDQGKLARTEQGRWRSVNWFHLIDFGVFSQVYHAFHEALLGGIHVGSSCMLSAWQMFVRLLLGRKFRFFLVGRERFLQRRQETVFSIIVLFGRVIILLLESLFEVEGEEALFDGLIAKVHIKRQDGQSPINNLYCMSAYYSIWESEFAIVGYIYIDWMIGKTGIKMIII